MTAFKEGRGNTVETLGLADGTYNMNVSLSGGSGKASISSPAKVTVTNGKAVAEIVSATARKVVVPLIKIERLNSCLAI